MKTLPIYFIIILILSCQPEKLNNTKVIISKKSENALLIIYNREEKNTEYIDRSIPTKESYQFWRKGFDPPFDDPNLHISVSHKLEHVTKTINRKELDQMNVWFDSEMGYMDWFQLSFERYYIIYQDEYLVKGSLDPDHSFTAYEVNIHTGGVE